MSDRKFDCSYAARFLSHLAYGANGDFSLRFSNVHGVVFERKFVYMILAWYNVAYRSLYAGSHSYILGCCLRLANPPFVS
eukprot:6180781-Pleurochrysis_carterae.AAC.2